MEPVSPVISVEYKQSEVVYAADQPEYSPLPAIKSKDTPGLVLTRWRLTDSEREAVSLGADIWLSVFTFNQPLQPVLLEVPVCEADETNKAIMMGLEGDCSKA